MLVLPWKERLRVKVAILDTQHRELLDLIYNLLDSICVGCEQSIIDNLLAQLTDRTLAHFATEELLFKKLGYQDAGIHRQQHLFFIHELIRYRIGHSIGTYPLSAKEITSLAEWFENHIFEYDKKYSSFFIKHGLT